MRPYALILSNDKDISNSLSTLFSEQQPYFYLIFPNKTTLATIVRRLHRLTQIFCYTKQNYLRKSVSSAGNRKNNSLTATQVVLFEAIR